MKDEIIKVAEAVGTHPKTAAIIVGATGFNRWMVDWGTPMMDFVTWGLGVTLVCVLIRYHWQNTIKLKKENENK